MSKSLLLFSIIYILTTPVIQAQDFDTEVSKAIDNVSQQLNAKKDLQIAIYPFHYLKENEEALAEYITDEFWEGLPQQAITYAVMDRASFDEYYQEHQLKSDGLIDPRTEKQFGMLIAADAYITGKVYVFNSIIRLKVKVTDTETGKIIATGSQKLPITYDMAQYLELEDWEEKKKEIEKNKSDNPNCAQENVGDICFQNNTQNFFYVILQSVVQQGGQASYTERIKARSSRVYRRIALQPGEQGCIKDLPNKAYTYHTSGDTFGTYSSKSRQGNVYIKICESRLIIIN